MAQQPCNLVRIAMDVIRDSLPRAMDKSLDLGCMKASSLRANDVTRSWQPDPTGRKWCATWRTTPSTTPPARKPGVVTVRILKDPFSKTLVLQVEDSGPGIPVAERERVFQPFYRVLGTGRRMVPAWAAHRAGNCAPAQRQHQYRGRARSGHAGVCFYGALCKAALNATACFPIQLQACRGLPASAALVSKPAPSCRQ